MSFHLAPVFLEALESRLKALDFQRELLALLSEAQLQRGLTDLAPLRLRCSGTLKAGDLQSWCLANEEIQSRMADGRSIHWQDIQAINQILTKRSPQDLIRDRDIYLGPWKARSVSELPQALGKFQAELPEILRIQHPVMAAAWLHFELVSLHPFWDANGRTSVLAADWILVQNGYLPQAFQRQLDALIGHLPDRHTSSTLERAILKVLDNIERSYQVVLETMAPTNVDDFKKSSSL